MRLLRFLARLFVRKEEKSVRQFLSNVMLSPVTYAKKRMLLDTRSPRIRYSALVMTVIGIASPLIVAVCLAQEHHPFGVLFSLVSGFAPLIGLSALLVILALLFSLLLCSVERTLCSNDDTSAPERRKKHRWRVVRPCLSHLLADCLSLKEHSPPAFLLS